MTSMTAMNLMTTTMEPSGMSTLSGVNTNQRANLKPQPLGFQVKFVGNSAIFRGYFFMQTQHPLFNPASFRLLQLKSFCLKL